MIRIQRNLFCFLSLVFIIAFLVNLNYVRVKFQYKYKVHPNKISCNMSMIESDKFICESDENWQKRREFYLQRHEKNILTMNEYQDYLLKNWIEEFKCKNETRLGTGDGGKWACDIEYLKTKPSCLVYSLGSGRDFRFESDVHKRLPNCSIHTFDVQYATCPSNVCKFHLLKLGNGQNGTKTLRQLMTDLNHTNMEIDILKIDIEYAEYVFLHTHFSNSDMNRRLKPVYIRQILMEVHLDRERIFETNALFYLLNSQNYVIYHKELPVAFSFFASEFGFLKLNRKFFR